MSLNFDSASPTIVLSLNSLNAQLNETETQLSTGNAINSPADNPVLWDEAASEQSDAAGWGDVANEIEDVDSPELKTATGALSTVLSTLDDMWKLVEGVESGGDDDTTTALSNLNKYATALDDTITTAVSSNDVNLLNGTAAATVSFVEGYDQTGGVQTNSFTTQSLKLGAKNSLLVNVPLAFGDDDLLTAKTLTNIQGAITAVRSYSDSLGGMSSSQTTMQNFAQTMQTNLQDGADDLIGVDYNALSAREAALQTQIQLATQALSISTQSSQLILKLFQ